MKIPNVIESKINKSFRIEPSIYEKIKFVFRLKSMNMAEFIRLSLIRFMEEALKDKRIKKEFDKKFKENK